MAKHLPLALTPEKYIKIVNSYEGMTRNQIWQKLRGAYSELAGKSNSQFNNLWFTLQKDLRPIQASHEQPQSKTRGRPPNSNQDPLKSTSFCDEQMQCITVLKNEQEIHEVNNCQKLISQLQFCPCVVVSNSQVYYIIEDNVSRKSEKFLNRLAEISSLHQ